MNLGDLQSFNRYSYVSGDPINFVDPSGLLMICRTYSQWTWINVPSSDGSPNVVGAIRELTECTQLFGGGGGSGIFTYQPQPTISIEGSGSGGSGSEQTELSLNLPAPNDRNRPRHPERYAACLKEADRKHNERLQKARDDWNRASSQLNFGDAIGIVASGFWGLRSGLKGALGGVAFSTGAAKVGKLVTPAGNLFFAKVFDDKWVGARRRCREAYGPPRRYLTA